MKNTILSLMLIAGLVSGARAQNSGTVASDQDVIKTSATVISITLSQAFIQVDTGPNSTPGHMTDSWFVEVQNLSTEQVCCAFDSAAGIGAATSKACVRIDTAPTATASGFVNWKRWKRYAQNLSLFCRSMKTTGTAELIITQGK